MDEHSAMVNGRDLPISTKQSVEISRFIRGKTIAKSRIQLQEVISMKRAIPFKRYNMDMGHKKGMAAGRYPVKSCKYFLKLFDSIEANAADKGLDLDKLYIKEIIPNKASAPPHYGRKRGTKMKRTHIKIVVEEFEDTKKVKEKPKEIKEKKVESKVQEKQVKEGEKK